MEYTADTLSSHCVGYGSPKWGYNLSEDCLYLNVFRPLALTMAILYRLPSESTVYVGGYVQAGGSDIRYNLSFIVQRSVDGRPIIASAWTTDWAPGAFSSRKKCSTAGTLTSGALAVSAIVESRSPIATDDADMTSMQALYNALVSQARCDGSVDSLQCLRELPPPSRTAMPWSTPRRCRPGPPKIDGDFFFARAFRDQIADGSFGLNTTSDLRQTLLSSSSDSITEAYVEELLAAYRGYDPTTSSPTYPPTTSRPRSRRVCCNGGAPQPSKLRRPLSDRGPAYCFRFNTMLNLDGVRYAPVRTRPF
ncbi:Uu.00g031770.m01.CDS01 [Anthostomella pinea]|uniref:Uu.00g031770.m01.CDS01 n=1 Tax=Anthostomella pinea TaxID=933095 RepID=A0AAI8YAP9_9PEZI|nr:Uu.00g031770.m01.CDS01 [Anthostomella pinea]